MKILILTDDFPPNSRGGAAIIAKNLAIESIKKGDDVLVFTTVNDKKQAGEITLAGIKIKSIYFPKYFGKLRNYISVYNPFVIYKLRKILNIFRPDIVHAHNIHLNISYWSLLVCLKYTKKVFLTTHDAVASWIRGKIIPKRKKCPPIIDVDYKINWWQELKSEKIFFNPLRRIILRKIFSKIKKVFSVSSELKEMFEVNGFSNLEVIHNGIDLSNWEINNDEAGIIKDKYNLKNKKIVLFSGRASKLKGVDNLIKAILDVKKEIPNIMLIIIGIGGGYKDYLEKEVKNIDISKNIIFLEWLPHNEIKKFYNICNLVIIPSLILDSFPTVNLEAMASKKPLISTCFGGSKEIIKDGKSGYIINPYNVSDISDKIIDILKDDKKAQEFGQFGYNIVKNNFSIDEQVRKIYRWYND